MDAQVGIDTTSVNHSIRTLARVCPLFRADVRAGGSPPGNSPFAIRAYCFTVSHSPTTDRDRAGIELATSGLKAD